LPQRKVAKGGRAKALLTFASGQGSPGGRALSDRALGPRAETRRSPSFRISDKQKCRTADYLRSTCWPASRRHRADNVESEAVAAAKSLPGGALGIARLAGLQVTPIESACKYAEGRDNSDDHDDLCRHRTNSIWFIGTIKRNSSPPGFDLDQTECRKFNAQPWRPAAPRLLAIVCHRWHRSMSATVNCACD
jgi:hypothetical protein